MKILYLRPALLARVIASSLLNNRTNSYVEIIMKMILDIAYKNIKLSSFADEHLGGENIYESSAFRNQFLMFNYQNSFLLKIKSKVTKID